MFIDFRERGRGKRRERERNRNINRRNFDWLPPICAPTRDGTRNPGVLLDWVLNQPLGVQDTLQSSHTGQGQKLCCR